MDYLSLIKNEEIIEYVENLNYATGRMGQKLFPARKVADPIVRMRRLVEGGNVPVMAQVHAYDTEARIGNRVNFEEIKLSALLIKEKLPTSERLAEMLGRNPMKSDIYDFVFDDFNTLVQRNLTRHEVADMELLCTGKMTIDENNVKKVVDYKMPDGNKIAISGWNDPTHDILGDIVKIQRAAQKAGYKIVRAITSSTMVGYILSNNAILGKFATLITPVTETNVLNWLQGNYGIEFVVNDDVYKTDALDTTTHRFFDENTISWLTTTGAIGEGLYGITPEQRQLRVTEVREKMLVTITRWEDPDAAITWTKGSSLYLPVIKDINGLFISKHTATTPSKPSNP